MMEQTQIKTLVNQVFEKTTCNHSVRFEEVFFEITGQLAPGHKFAIAINKRDFEGTPNRSDFLRKTLEEVVKKYLYEHFHVDSDSTYTGDHLPSGETWHILGIDVKGNRVCASGWPPTTGKLTDMRNMEKHKPISSEEKTHRVKEFGTNWN